MTVVWSCNRILDWQSRGHVSIHFV